MCDWTMAAYALMAAGTAHSAETARKEGSQARQAQKDLIDAQAGDRQRAEAEAAQSAAARLSETNRRRRTQGSLIARGAAADAANPLASSAAPQAMADPTSSSGGAPLIARGRQSATFFGG